MSPSVRNTRRSIEQFEDTVSTADGVIAPLPEPKLPDLDLPQSELDLTMTFDSIMSESSSVSSTSTAPEPEYVYILCPPCYRNLFFSSPAHADSDSAVWWPTRRHVPLSYHVHVGCFAIGIEIDGTFLRYRFDKVQKRASNVLKLAQENEKLKEELRAMNERIEAAERRQQELRQQRQTADGAKAS
jgi:outer membrane murein-binding lipoprotein Lpp